MNLKKILWKKRNFKWIRILLCIVQLFAPSCGRVSYAKAKFHLFNNKFNLFESELLKSMETTKNLFAQPEFKQALLVGSRIANVVPYAAPVTGMFYVVSSLLAYESDYRANFAGAIAHETKREIAVQAVDLIYSKIKKIRKKIHLMNEQHAINRRLRTASETHSDIAQMLNVYEKSDSIFKKFPLLGAPMLLVLAQFIVQFEPTMKRLDAEEAKSPELSCQMCNILIDYLPRTVNDRIEKLNVVYDKLQKIARGLSYVMSIPYAHGEYHLVNSNSLNASFDCDRGCNEPDECLNDDYGDTYNLTESCVIDYGFYIRYRFEELFDLELLNELCVDPPQPTGFGWLTIKLKYVRARTSLNGSICDLFGYCDIFVKLFMDGKELLKTPTRPDSYSHDVNVIYTSPKITKEAFIKIEVWDENQWTDPSLLVTTNGSVSSFLEKGHRENPVQYSQWLPELYGGTLTYDDVNYINTFSVWQDEFKHTQTENFETQKIFSTNVN